MNKLIVAPQIVVYKNIFKHNERLIKYLNNIKWENWFNHGERSKSFYSKSNTYKDEEEVFLMENISSLFEYIKKDYMNDFKKEKGIWPEWIKDWDALEKDNDIYIIDYFKYDGEKVLENMDIKPNGNMMGYHVDEFPIPGIIKPEKNVVTINFYLNDDYEGGEICAYDSVSNKSYKYKPKAGDAVVMPSTIPFYHAVKTFTGNERLFFRIFIDYKFDLNKDMKYSNDDDVIRNHTGTNQEEEYRKNSLQFIDIDIEEIEVL